MVELIDTINTNHTHHNHHCNNVPREHADHACTLGQCCALDACSDAGLQQISTSPKQHLVCWGVANVLLAQFFSRFPQIFFFIHIELFLLKRQPSGI